VGRITRQTLKKRLKIGNLATELADTSETNGQGRQLLKISKSAYVFFLKTQTYHAI